MPEMSPFWSDVVYGGSRMVAACALAGGVWLGLYKLDQAVANDRANQIEACANLDTPPAVRACTEDANTLRGVTGLAELAAGCTTVGLAVTFFADGVGDMFRYRSRGGGQGRQGQALAPLPTTLYDEQSPPSWKTRRITSPQNE